MNKLSEIINNNPPYYVVYLLYNNSDQRDGILRAISKFGVFESFPDTSRFDQNDFTSIVLDFNSGKVLLSQRGGTSLTIKRIAKDFNVSQSRVFICNSEVFFKLEKHKKIKFKIDA